MSGHVHSFLDGQYQELQTESVRLWSVHSHSGAAGFFLQHALEPRPYVPALRRTLGRSSYLAGRGRESLPACRHRDRSGRCGDYRTPDRLRPPLASRSNTPKPAFSLPIPPRSMVWLASTSDRPTGRQTITTRCSDHGDERSQVIISSLRQICAAMDHCQR